MGKKDLRNPAMESQTDLLIRNKIKDAFDTVSTGDLKASTIQFVMENQKKPAQNFRKGLFFHPFPAMAGGFFAVILAVLIPVYFFPTVFISVDINPSLELGINRLNRVVSVKGFNEDGEILAKKLDIRFMDYQDALNLILKNPKISELLAADGVMSFCVVGRNRGKNQEMKILSTLEEKTKTSLNTYCHYADFKEVKEAHHQGLSYGKYKALMQLKKNYPEIQPENFRNIPMKDIHRMLENSGENDPDFFEQSERQGFRHNGKQAQNGHHNRGKDSPSHEKGPKSRNMK